MLVLLHVTLALLSIGVASLSLLFPSKIKLYSIYFLSGFTLITGIVLGISTRTNPLQACIIGSLFVGYILGTVVLAKRRLDSV